MGYSILIGQLEAEVIEGEAHTYVREVVEFDAPYHPNDDVTGRSNHRAPSYRAWGDFTKTVGLHDLFFNKETGLMREHPSIVELTESHYQAINEAYLAYTGVGWWLAHSEDRERPQYEYNCIRLNWLRYWVRWALDNCGTPCIQNF